MKQCKIINFSVSSIKAQHRTKASAALGDYRTINAAYLMKRSGCTMLPFLALCNVTYSINIVNC